MPRRNPIRPGVCEWHDKPLPVVPFELRGFLLIVGFLLDYQFRVEEITRRYVEGMRRLHPKGKEEP